MSLLDRLSRMANKSTATIDEMIANALEEKVRYFLRGRPDSIGIVYLRVTESEWRAICRARGIGHAESTLGSRILRLFDLGARHAYGGFERVRA